MGAGRAAIGRLSWGEYGRRRGVPRILSTLARHDVRATFFVPAVSGLIEPSALGPIVEAGHEIGVHAIRVGDNVGEHTIVFSTLGETMELSHRAHARDCYARGALQAAKFMAGRPAGRYTMNDVLGL